MAIQTLDGFICPGSLLFSFTETPIPIDASGEKLAFVFQVPKSGTLDKAEFRIGSTLTFAGGSVLRVSFQDVSTTTGDPDGTQDQYRDMSSLTGGAWNVPGLMTSDGTDTGTKRTVTKGAMLAVVLEYQTFVATDTLGVSMLTKTASDPDFNLGYSSQFASSVWTKLGRYPLLSLKYSDGTYASPKGSLPISGNAVVSFNSDSTPDERGLRFQLPFPARLSGFTAQADLDQATSFVLYDSAGTAISGGTVTTDPDIRETASAARSHYEFDASIELAANTAYYLLMKPSAASPDVSLTEFDTASAAIMAGARPGGEWYFAQRTNGGAISTTTTKRPAIQLFFDGFSSGGQTVYQGMQNIEAGA